MAGHMEIGDAEQIQQQRMKSDGRGQGSEAAGCLPGTLPDVLRGHR